MFQRPDYQQESSDSQHDPQMLLENPTEMAAIHSTPNLNAVPKRPESDYMHLGEREALVPKLYERIESAPDFDNDSECTCSSIGERGSESDLDLSDLENDGGVNDSKDAETQTDDVLTPDGACASLPLDKSVDSLQGTKNGIKKLKNINDLLKKIDEQFNTVLKQTQNDLSPASSEETHCSDPEADRQFGDQFFSRPEHRYRR